MGVQRFKQMNKRDSRTLPERAKGVRSYCPDDSQKEVTFTRLIRSSAYRNPSSQVLSVVDWVKESVQSRVLANHASSRVFFPTSACPFSFYIGFAFYYAVLRPGQVLYQLFSSCTDLSMKRFPGCLSYFSKLTHGEDVREINSTGPSFPSLVIDPCYSFLLNRMNHFTMLLWAVA